MSDDKYRFLKSLTAPSVTARIEIRAAKKDRITLIAKPYFTNSLKCIPGSPTFQRTMAISALDAGLQTMLSLIEKYAEENADMIMSAHVTEAIKKGKNEKKKEKTELGIYSTAYRSLPDPQILFSGWRKNSTARSTQTYFEGQILPRIDKLGYNIQKEKLDEIVEELVTKAKNNKRGGHNTEKARDSVSKQLYRIDIVLERLHILRDIPHVTFGFHASAISKTEHEKALPARIRIRFAAALRRLRKDPRSAGCALMFTMGHRTAEACAPLIKDFVLNHLGFVVYFVGHQIKDGERVEMTKTSSGFRLTVGGPLMYIIIQSRIETLLEQGYTMEQVMEMPLVSEPDDPTKFLDPKTLSAYAKELLFACGYTKEALLAAQALSEKEPDIVNGEEVKEPECYLLRRDWVSRALNICGLNPKDVDYLIGHKREDKSITVFNDPAVQYALAMQLDGCVLLPNCTLHPAFNPIVLSDNIIDFTRFTQYRVKNTGTRKRITIHVKTADGGEDIRLKTIGKVIAVRRKTGELDRPDDREKRPIVLPPYSRETLEKEIAYAEALDLSKFMP